MRALVTGGAGFIGSNLVDRLLAEGHAVDVVDDLSTGSLANLSDARSDPANELTFSRMDIRSDAVLDHMTRRRPDVVFHLASQRDDRRPVVDAEINVLGSLNVLEGARACGARKVVFAGSGTTLYGDVDPSDLPVKETMPHCPLTPFGVAKKAVGDYLLAYRESHGLEFTVLALADVYGPRQGAGGGVVQAFASRLLAGQPCTVFGDGTQTRDFVYVDDVVDAFARAADKGGGLTLNVGTGVETSVNELYAALAAALGLEVSDAAPTFGPARSGEVVRFALDPTRAGHYLGWKPWTSVAEGARATLQYLSSHP